jgi:2-amino-4-hydroxy-6-hydroxymethyldihydropteridine diphosphokinase
LNAELHVNERVFIGLGSNLGDREGYIERAIAALRATPGVTLIAQASLYETEPVGMEDQPWFLNTAVEIRTTLPPQALLQRFKAIEKALGRKGRKRWGPREIDLDLLLYGDRVICEPDLTVPHPELARRRFALAPLAELAPEVVHPVLRRTIAELLQQLEARDTKGVRVLPERLK